MGPTAISAQADLLRRGFAFKHLRGRTVAINFQEVRGLLALDFKALVDFQERLAEKAGLSLAGFAEESQSVELASFNTPKAVEPHCSFIKGRSGWVVTASGGVDINGFEVVQNQVADASGSKVREDALAASTGKTWWWNK